MENGKQSQKHGFVFENEIREKVFNLCHHSNDTNVHDIPCEHNTMNPNENISIKATGSYTIFCGDILRFFDYDFSKINTIICQVCSVERLQNDQKYIRDQLQRRMS